MAGQSSRQRRMSEKSMTTAKGPHLLQRENNSGNKYDQMVAQNEFFVISGPDYTSNKSKPEEKTTPSLNKDAGYNK